MNQQQYQRPSKQHTPRRVAPVPPPMVEEPPPDHPPFLEGDLVRLKSGSPDMTVCWIKQLMNGGWVISTSWCCLDGKLESFDGLSECLVTVPKPETPAPKG